jgi:hypothetical protein
MEITLESFSREHVSSDMVGLAAAELAARVPDPDQIKLTFSGDFRKSVRERTDDEWERENYETDRLFGQVGARVMSHADGSIDVVVDVGHVDPETTSEDALQRTIAHEAWHVATTARGESLNDIRVRRGLSDVSREGSFLALAGIAAEEFRVERALCEEGFHLRQEHRHQVPEMLKLFREEINEGMTIRYPGESVERCCRTVATAFHRVSILLSYLAADEIVGGTALQVALPLWDRLVGENYARFRDALAALPSAAVETSLAELERRLPEITLVLEGWLGDLGFWIEDREGNEMFWGINADRVAEAIAMG